jgi:hypothetical protein
VCPKKQSPAPPRTWRMASTSSWSSRARSASTQWHQTHCHAMSCRKLQCANCPGWLSQAVGQLRPDRPAVGRLAINIRPALGGGRQVDVVTGPQTQHQPDWLHTARVQRAPLRQGPSVDRYCKCDCKPLCRKCCFLPAGLKEGHWDDP